MQKSSANPASVPGQYYGFSIQPTRQCLRLFLAPAGSVVALEVLDDVDVIQPGGKVTAEQAKSGLATNPISDWSIDLWKTFANWIDAVETGLLELARTSFHLYVVQKKKGELVDKLKYAHTPEIALSVVAEIKAKYESEKPTGCKSYIEKFLSYEPEKLAQLICRFDYEAGDSDPAKPITDYLRATIPDVFLEAACAAAIGWVKKRADELIGMGKHPGIQRDEFSDWLSTFCSKIDYDHLLTYSAAQPQRADVESSIPEFPVMMRQLDLIERRYRDKVKAMTDYMQTKATKIKWAEKGLVVEDQFKDFEDMLLDHWELNSIELKAQIELTEIDKGRALYLKCSLLAPKINGKEIPSHFTNGTFQYLSNDQIIGWHPRYKELL
jgi:hypothetical protein